MAYVPHTVVKPKLIAETGIDILGEKLDALSSLTKFVPDQFFGSEGDTVSVRVKGTLPVREYGWKNDRSEPIKTDVYKETKVDLTVGALNTYSSTKLTDEDKKFDFNGDFGRLTDAQTDTIAEDLERRALKHILAAPFEACLAIDPSTANIKAQAEIGRDYLYNKFVEAAQILSKLRAPKDERFARVGANIAAQIRMNQKLVLANGANTDGAFNSFVIGSYAGFNCVEDPSLPADEAIVYVKSAYQYWNYAPSIPQGAIAGAIAAKNGVQMRWIHDYDPGYQVERSTWSTWSGFAHAKDMLKAVNTDETQMLIGTQQYFLRGLKIVIGAASAGWVPGDGGVNGGERKGASPTSELGLVYTGQPFAGTRGEGSNYPNVLDTAIAAAADLVP